MCLFSISHLLSGVCGEAVQLPPVAKVRVSARRVVRHVAHVGPEALSTQPAASRVPVEARRWRLGNLVSVAPPRVHRSGVNVNTTHPDDLDALPAQPAASRVPV